MDVKELSPSTYMALGISSGVVLGIVLAWLTHKASPIVVVGYPLGLAFGIFLKNRYARNNSTGSSMTSKEKRTQVIMIILICVVVMMGMISFFVLSH